MLPAVLETTRLKKGRKSDAFKKGERPTKKVIDVDSGKIYNSIREASEFVDMSKTMLSRVLRGHFKNKTTLKLYEN